jgi:hypothetical protein
MTPYTDGRFRDEPVTPVWRHWLCPKDGCDGEMKSTGHGLTTLSTSWQHRCTKCQHEALAGANYPRVAYLPIEQIQPADGETAGETK